MCHACWVLAEVLPCFGLAVQGLYEVVGTVHRGYEDYQTVAALTGIAVVHIKLFFWITNTNSDQIFKFRILNFKIIKKLDDLTVKTHF